MDKNEKLKQIAEIRRKTLLVMRRIDEKFVAEKLRLLRNGQDRSNSGTS